MGNGLPKKSNVESDGEACSEDENVSSSGSREGNVCNDALYVIGLYGFGDKISFFLQDLELAKVALSCHMAWTCCARKCMRPGWLVRGCQKALCHNRESLSLTVDGLRQKRRGLW